MENNKFQDTMSEKRLEQLDRIMYYTKNHMPRVCSDRTETLYNTLGEIGHFVIETYSDYKVFISMRNTLPTLYKGYAKMLKPFNKYVEPITNVNMPSASSVINSAEYSDKKPLGVDQFIEITKNILYIHMDLFDNLIKDNNIKIASSPAQQLNLFNQRPELQAQTFEYKPGIGEEIERRYETEVLNKFPETITVNGDGVIPKNSMDEFIKAANEAAGVDLELEESAGTEKFMAAIGEDSVELGDELND